MRKNFFPREFSPLVRPQNLQDLLYIFSFFTFKILLYRFLPAFMV